MRRSMVARPSRSSVEAASDLVWYASYGSNLSKSRFGVYLRGGQLPGRPRLYTGARDVTSPRADMPLMLNGQVYFAGQSSVWGGGFGLFDPSSDGTTPARAYLVTLEQFSDVVAQEMGRPPGPTLDVSRAIRAGRDTLGPGPYETIVRTGFVNNIPVLTFTAPAPRRPLSVPAAPYLAVIGRGIIEAHGWCPTRTGTYLASLPGAAGHWQAESVADLLT